ncbi:TPA: hypothetical protein HA338_05825 [Methanosarcina acetivorans]|uniref:Uncharacterized protein n=1 Tax=Methanosarcina acetivorans TaxID=2214 RepID=A0A832W9C6_9EURY|nr:hypothetical protein [Methanosarcina acetivorans]HIH93561.1 hypothetical protein [Methanosarcina acetivorans]
MGKLVSLKIFKQIGTTGKGIEYDQSGVVDKKGEISWGQKRRKRDIKGT